MIFCQTDNPSNSTQGMQQERDVGRAPRTISEDVHLGAAENIAVRADQRIR
jgi:hypothetical protein